MPLSPGFVASPSTRRPVGLNSPIWGTFPNFAAYFRTNSPPAPLGPMSQVTLKLKLSQEMNSEPPHPPFPPGRLFLTPHYHPGAPRRPFLCLIYRNRRKNVDEEKTVTLGLISRERGEIQRRITCR